MPDTMRPRPSAGVTSLAELFTALRDRAIAMLSRDVEPFERTIQKIDAMGKMTPGWNGFRAAVAPDDVRQIAINFFREIPRRFPSDIREPALTPLSLTILNKRICETLATWVPPHNSMENPPISTTRT